MLVLSRKQDQVICIGDDIYVRVLRISPDSVRIGVDAPAEIPVDRMEVRNLINEEQQRGHSQTS